VELANKKKHISDPFDFSFGWERDTMLVDDDDEIDSVIQKAA
jgi:hypothetical protein